VQVGAFAAAAAHDGYGHLPGRPTHRRRWTLEDASLLVEDWLAWADGRPSAPLAVARFPLYPGLELVESGPRRWSLMAAGELVASAEVELGAARLEHWEQARRFGELTPAVTLAVTLEDSRAAVRWQWTT
jgi:Heparinase II/III-like protein